MISIRLPNDDAEDLADILYTCVELDYPVMNVDLVEKVIKQIEEKLEE
ncbi:hypothetical protein KAR91_29225 [Candidatus Pacearchaeota archaeon]|nr:hypothetical protein [Candidatus Pacearchaeota archaeon]